MASSPAPTYKGRPLVRTAQVSCVAGIALLTGLAPVGRTAVGVGGVILFVCAAAAVVAVLRVRDQLPPIQRRIFRWLAAAGILSALGKVWWTADVLLHNAPSPYPSAPDFIMAGAQLVVTAGFVHALGRQRTRLRFEAIVDVALVGVAAVIMFLPMRLGEMMSLHGAAGLARMVAMGSVAIAAASLLMLALLIAARGYELTRHALLGLAVGAVSLAVFTSWAATLAMSGQPIPHSGMDVVGLAAILGFVSALDVPAGDSTLELRVAERTAQLSGAVQELTQEIGRERAMRAQIIERERLASIGSIVAGAAHEINNPLSAISAFAQLLLKDEPLTPSQREAVEIIHSETGRAANVIRDLRAFARRNPGDEQRSVDLNELIERTLRLRSYQMTTAGMRVETELDDYLPAVLGDPQALQQIVGNLVENSLQAMRGADAGVLRIVTYAREGRVLLDVTDTGPGIPAAARDKLFDPFFSTRPEGEGSGLGLSVTYGIVAAHGGTIRLADASPGHTTFTVELPAAGAPLRPEEIASVTNSSSS